MPASVMADLEHKWLEPVIMFVLGFSGMMIGLAIDLQAILPQAIATLCTRPHSLRDSIALHATLLPATNLLMFASGLVAALYAAWPSRVGHGAWRAHLSILLPAIACSATMLSGMFLSEWFAPQVARYIGLTWTVPAMVGAMAAGMAGGMILWTAIGSMAARAFSD